LKKELTSGPGSGYTPSLCVIACRDRQEKMFKKNAFRSDCSQKERERESQRERERERQRERNEKHTQRNAESEKYSPHAAAHTRGGGERRETHIQRERDTQEIRTHT